MVFCLIMINLEIKLMIVCMGVKDLLVHKDDVFEESWGRASLLTGSLIPNIYSEKIEKGKHGTEETVRDFWTAVQKKRTEHEVGTQDWKLYQTIMTEGYMCCNGERCLTRGRRFDLEITIIFLANIHNRFVLS